MCFACRNSLDPTIVDIFYVSDNNRGMVDGINLSPKEPFGEHPSQAIGQVIYVELNVHRGMVVAVIESREVVNLGGCMLNCRTLLEILRGSR